MYYRSSSQTAALLILKCHTKQSPKKVVTRGGQEKNNDGIQDVLDISRTIHYLDAISPRMTDGAASLSPNPQVSHKTFSKEGANKGRPKREKNNPGIPPRCPRHLSDPLGFGHPLSADDRWSSLFAQ
ncbi:hypothetical protein CEXT_214401 [Caerostris extrusa]|uniref:Uncharacterized protein n=1 Tax=Caerostris extrusa TaxID=172846 RepID=A0AAV4NEI3_CAEEX|nr:hypothetical protein CEXT_214401 [Caerostris extrusa]